MKIGIISLVSDVQGSDAINRASAPIINELKKSFDLEEIDIQDNRLVDLPVIFIKTGGTEYKFKQIAPKLAESGKPITILSTGSNNSLPAALEILSWANNEGFKNNLLLHGSTELLKEKLEKRILDVRFMDELKRIKIGVMGKPSDWLIASDVDYEKVMSRWGVSLLDIELEEVIENIEKFYDSNETEISHFFSNAQFTRGVDQKDIINGAKIYMGIKKTVSDYGLSALTLRCFDLLEHFNNTGCLALARLNDEGIPAGCEGDIPALFTLIINRLITGKPGFMANPSQINGNCIIMAHCTVPMSMVDTFGLRTHFESGKGVGIAGKFKKGPVTISKIGGSQLGQFYVDEGTIYANSESEELCRTQITIKINKGIDYFLNSPLGNHHIICNGNHAERFEEVMILFSALKVSTIFSH